MKHLIFKLPPPDQCRTGASCDRGTLQRRGRGGACRLAHRVSQASSLEIPRLEHAWWPRRPQSGM